MEAQWSDDDCVRLARASARRGEFQPYRLTPDPRILGLLLPLHWDGWMGPLLSVDYSRISYMRQVCLRIV